MLRRTTSSEITGHVRVVLLWVLSLMGVFSWVGHAGAFDQACGVLFAPHRATEEAVVVAVQTSGRATGTYMEVQQGMRQWRLAEGDFTLTGRGFIVDQFVVTAAHVVSPAKVDLRLNAYITTTTEVGCGCLSQPAIGSRDSASTGFATIPLSLPASGDLVE